MTRTVRIAGLVAALCCAARPAAAQAPTAVLTLDEAIAEALAHNPSLARTALDIARADHLVQSASSRRLPSFRLDGQASQLLRPVEIQFPAGAFGVPYGTTIRTPTRPTFYLNAQIVQPLTGLRAIGLNIRLTENDRAASREAQRAAELTVIAEVKRLYYGILQSESALAAADASIALLDEVERVIADRVVQRVTLRSEALDVRTRRARAEDRRLSIVHAMAARKEELNRLLGRDITTPFDTMGLAAATQTTVDAGAATATALDRRPDLRQARLQQTRADLATALARADAIPDVNLAASYLSPFNIDGAPRAIASLAVTVEWEPFDWGRRRRTVATRTIESQQAALAVRDAEAAALVDVHEQLRRIEQARSRLRVASLARESAYEIGRVRTSQFRVQAALLQDVLAAEATLADAETEQQQALTEFWLAWAGFERAIGQDVRK